MGINYLKKIEGGAYESTLHPPVFGKADGFGDFYVDGVWYEPHNLATNGSFYNDITGWVAESASTVSWDNGRLYSIGTTNYDGAKTSTANVTTVIGKKYKITCDFELGTATSFYISKVAGNNQHSKVYTSDGTAVLEFTADTTAISIYIRTKTSIGSFWADNIQVTSLDPADWTPYATPITYLPHAIEADIDGNVVEVSDFDVPDVVVNSIAVQDLNVTRTHIPETGVQIGGGELLWGDGSITGSNGNGSYTKYPNGDLVCTASTINIAPTLVNSNSYGSTSGTSYYVTKSIVFPKSFIDADAIVTASGKLIRTVQIRHETITTTGFTLQAFSQVNTRDEPVQYIAKGRWK